jgi:hypothetical protein
MKFSKTTRCFALACFGLLIANLAFAHPIHTLVLVNDRQRQNCKSEPSEEAKEVCFNYVENEDQILRLLKHVKGKFPEILSIQFESDVKISDRIVQAIATDFTHLKSLSIYKYDSIMSAAYFISQLKELKRLHIGYQSGFGALEFTFFKDLPKLRELHLSSVSTLSDSYISELEKLEKLRRLEIRGGRLTPEGIKNFSRFSKLKSLRITENLEVIPAGTIDAFKGHRYLRHNDNLTLGNAP